MKHYKSLHKTLPDPETRIEVHHDIFASLRSTLSRSRDGKFNKAAQTNFKDPGGSEDCMLCHPNVKLKKNPAGSHHEEVCGLPVETFSNDFPYLPIDHRLFFLREVGHEGRCHRFHISHFGAPDLYFLLTACLRAAKLFERPARIPHQVRMVAGFNIGFLAGQSLPHIHLQYGWEVLVEEARVFSDSALALYLDELMQAGLVIAVFEKNHLVVPWTPMGGFAVDLFLVGHYRFDELQEDDIKMIAVVGGALLQRYYWYLGITNVNIVVQSSPFSLELEPLVIRFVPRLNLTAMYEIHGSNVVDTFPETIHRKMTEPCNGGPTGKPVRGVDPWPRERPVIAPWREILAGAPRFDPWHSYRSR